MAKMILDIYHGERGIDLADWKRRHGLWGVIVKCGGSDDSYWNRFEETTFVEQATQAHELGLHVGAYYYSDALTAEDALADAEHCVNKCMRGVRLDIPIYLDVEEPAQLRLNMRQLTDVITTFCGRVRAAGYDVGVYAGYQVFNNVYMDELAGYSLWVASWQQSWPLWARDYDLWQEGSIDLAGNKYHREGEVDGPGKIDLDWASDKFVARIESGGGTMPTVKTGWAERLDECQDPADYAYCTCKVYSCGYSQPNRKSISVERLKAGTAECDCSSGVSWWLYMGGYLDECPWFYTAIERDYLAQHGFEVIDANSGFVKMQRNDVLLRSGHTALYIGDGLQAEAMRTERHDAGYNGSTPGDQDGGETIVRKLTLDWDYVIRKRNPPSYGPATDEKGNTDNKGAAMTAFFVKLDGDPTEMYCPDGIHLHAIANADEKKAIMDFYKLGHPGQSLDPTPKTFGSEDAPWGARYNDVLSRGANFRGFERFNKHPSLRATVTDIVRTELANADAMAQKVLDAIR